MVISCESALAIVVEARAGGRKLLDVIVAKAKEREIPPLDLASAMMRAIDGDAKPELELATASLLLVVS